MNAAGLRERARRRLSDARRAGQLRAESDQLRRAEAAQVSHIHHLEARLHIAEHRLARLDEYGLVEPLSENPASFARWLTWRPPGHFYSPVPNLEEIERHAEHLWAPGRGEVVPGVDLNPDGQLAVFQAVAALARDYNVPAHATPGRRYHSENVSFGISDALVLHGMLRHVRPRRMIEIGSGFSSAMTLDTNELFLDSAVDLTFIEPYPELLESLLAPADRDRVTIIAESLQDVPLERFDVLESGDVLFIDSTHVLRTGGDVVYLYTALLPRLAPGVYVHIHDIFRGFEYPRDWVLEGRAWGEAYIVQAFLTMNSEFEILLFKTGCGTSTPTS